MVDEQVTLFRDREDAARQLAASFRARPMRDPLVLAIPRGGVVTGAVLARELGAELDVVLARKIRAPLQPEYALGAVSERGQVTLNPEARDVAGVSDAYLRHETQHQLAEIDRRKRLVRQIRPVARPRGRTVILTDDGIATGATMIAALKAVRAENPDELIVAVPVAAADRLAEVQNWCDEIVCLLTPEDFAAVGQFYEDFTAVEDEDVVRLLRENWTTRANQ